MRSQFPKIQLFRKGENFGMFYSGYSGLFRIFRFSYTPEGARLEKLAGSLPSPPPRGVGTGR